MSDSQDTVPYGYCHCGCGGQTNTHSRTWKARGEIAGEPRRFLPGHNGRRSGPQYVEEDRGYFTPCWIWQGTVHARSGYPRIWRDGKDHRAHRWMYEQLVGPIPDELTLDHLCFVRSCVNPAHLEPVTNVENSMRGNSPWARNARKTHCKRGHPFDEKNTFVRKTGARACRACAAEWMRQKRRKKN